MFEEIWLLKLKNRNKPKDKYKNKRTINSKSESGHTKWGCFPQGQLFSLDHSAISNVTDQSLNKLRFHIRETSTRKNRLANLD